MTALLKGKKGLLRAALFYFLVSSFTVVAAEQPWNEGVLTVAQGNFVNLSKNYATNYAAKAQAAVTLHGDMTVTSPRYYVFCWDGTSATPSASTVYFDLGGVSGDTGRLSLDGCSMSSYYSSARRVNVRDFAVRSPGVPAVSLANKSSLEVAYVTVTDSASSTGDYLTEFDIGEKGSLAFSKLTTATSKDVKILFSGEKASLLGGWAFSKGTYIFQMSSGAGDIILESTSTATIDLQARQGSYEQLLLNPVNPAAKLIFRGNCDVKLTSSRGSEASAIRTPIVINHPNVSFEQTGDLILAGTAYGDCSTRVIVEDVLPYGADVGIVRVVSIAGKPAHKLDICGGSHKLNGLVFENGSQLVCTNGAVTLTFGTDDTDGVVDGLDAAIAVVKTGTGTLTVTNATVASLVVSNGLVVVDGGTLTCGTLTTVDSGRIAYANGGRIVSSSGTAVWELPTTGDNLHAIAPTDVSQISGLGLSYGGTTAMTYLRGGTFSDVRVRSDTLRIGGQLVSDLYWRMTFTDAAGGEVNAKWDGASTFSKRFVSMALGRFHPLSTEGAAVNATTKEEGHFASDTTPAVATASGFIFVSTITHLGWGLSTADNCIGFTTEALSEQNPIVVTVKTKQPIWGYGMSRAGGCTVGAPAAWKVESSADGQTDWTLRDERTGQASRSVNMGQFEYGNDGIPYSLSSGAGNTFVATGCVEVAEGATLDLSDVPSSSISISALRVDPSAGAGGIITRFVPAVTGYVAIVNVPAASLTDYGNLKTKMALLTIGEAFNADRLSDWSVVVNGQRVNARLKLADGVLYAVPNKGLMFIVR